MKYLKFFEDIDNELYSTYSESDEVVKSDFFDSEEYAKFNPEEINNIRGMISIDWKLKTFTDSILYFFNNRQLRNRVISIYKYPKYFWLLSNEKYYKCYGLDGLKKCVQDIHLGRY